MTTNTDIVNRALQTFGSRTTVTATELTNNSTNEAIQANLVLTKYRDQLLRMAPWDCALNTKNLVYITSTPGTPENTSATTTLWQKGQPPPPWAYEYQYPVDCLRACWIVPSTQTGFSGVPITTAVTGSGPNTWTGPPVVFKVQIDQFKGVTAAAVVAGGTGYAIGDEITLPLGATSSAPIGAPVTLVVATLSGSAVATVTVKNQIAGSATPVGGSYFLAQSGTIAQDTTTGSGTGATFTLTQQSSQTDQRVILTNQEYATLTYVKQVTDPNVMDDLFIEAWCQVLGSRICSALTGDKSLVEQCIREANRIIAEARKVDGNEGISVNDVTPDFIRIRGIYDVNWQFSPNTAYDWGSYWSM